MLQNLSAKRPLMLVIVFEQMQQQYNVHIQVPSFRRSLSNVKRLFFFCFFLRDVFNTIDCRYIVVGYVMILDTLGNEES